MTYIFGSFARRRQSGDMRAPKKRSSDPVPASSQQRLNGRYEVSKTAVSSFPYSVSGFSQLHELRQNEEQQ